MNRNSKENGITSVLGRFCTPRQTGRYGRYGHGYDDVACATSLKTRATRALCIFTRRNYFRFRKVLHPLHFSVTVAREHPRHVTEKRARDSFPSTKFPTSKSVNILKLHNVLLRLGVRLGVRRAPSIAAAEAGAQAGAAQEETECAKF